MLRILLPLCALVVATRPAAIDVPTLGDPAPALTVDADDSVQLDWSELRGRVVVLEFWATWCGPCIPALEHLGELQSALEGEDIVFLGISPESAERMDRFLERHDVPFPIALDRDDATFGAYGVRTVPTTIVVDREGRIAARSRPTDVTETALRNVLDGKPAGLDELRDRAADLMWSPADSEDGEVFARVVIADSDASGGGSRFRPGSGAITGDGLLRSNLVQLAHRVPFTRIVDRMPPSDPKDVYRVSVLAPGGDDDLARLLLARSIDVKFGMETRLEEVEREVYVLRLQEGVDPWPPSTAPKTERTGSAFGGGLHHVGQPFDNARAWFENVLRTPVIDETGLDERYDLKLEWVDGGSFRAELARVGLELERATRPVQCLVVEPSS
ncbi:MAG: redoxin domain-containing protein [Planctomycetota bacterium]